MTRFFCFSTLLFVSTIVSAQPCQVNAGSDVTICLGQSVQLGGSPTAGVSFGGNPTFDWNNGAADVANPTVSPTSTTTYTVNVNGGICSSVGDQIVVTVLVPVLAGAQLTNYQGDPYFVQCVSGGSTGLIFVTNNNPASWNNLISAYSIDWGDGSPFFTTSNDNWPQQNHTYSPGLYELTYTVTGPGGCQASSVYNVFVGNTPAVGLNIPMNTEGCIPITVSFPITNTSNNVPGTTYTVTFSDDGSQQTFVHSALLGAPASVTHTFMQSSCGSTFQNGNILEQNAFGVTIQAQNPCGSSSAAVGPIRLSEPPVSSFTANPQTACTNSLVTITNTSDPGSLVTGTNCASNALFHWQISPATGWTVQSGSLGSSNGFAANNFAGWTAGSQSMGVNFNTPGTYTITHAIANGCGPSTSTQTICIISPPVCDFDVNTNSGCGPLSVVTDNNTIPPQCGNNALNMNYNWNVTVPGGGSYTVTNGSLTSASPTFNLTNTTTTPLTYTLTLTSSPINPQTGVSMTNCSSQCSETITVYPAPVISSHPTPNQTICVGGTPNMLSVAYQYGVGTPTYQWYSNTTNSNTGGTLIPGATSANYTPPALNTAGTYYYYAVISLGGTCGTITSNPACVLVVPDPTISTQPQAPQTICSGGNPSAIQMGYSNGTGTPSYQWFTNTGPGTTGGTPVAGATAASFTPTVPSTPGTYYFYGTLSLSGSGCATVTTASAQVIVIADPVISIPAVSFTYCQNAQASPITTSVSGGNGTNSYQWFQTTTATNTGGTPLSGQTGASFTPSTATVGTQYYYVQLTQSTSGCSSVSQPVTVTILPSASISIQPLPSTVCVGGTPTTLSASFVNGTGTPSYQWFSSTNSNGSNPVTIPGATSSTYVPPTNTAGTVYYFVTISFTSGGCSSISSTPAAVTVVPDPSLTLQSASTQELCIGGSLSSALTVNLTGGTGSPTYQWYSNTSASNTGGTSIPGATNATYTPPAFTSSGTFYYYATVSASGTGCDAAASAPATVVVVNDPVVSVQPLASQSVCQNSPAEPLSVSVTGGSGTATISWYSNANNSTTGGTLIGTGTSITPSTSAIGTVWYYAVINQSVSGCSVTSATASVTVTPAPSITAQPQPSTVCVGGTPTTMTVSIANGLGTPAYQWFSSPNSNGTSGTAISGATNPTFVPPTQSAGSTYYYVVISFVGGACSNLTSNTALVQVVADPAFSVQPSTPITVCQGTTLPSPLSFSVQGGTGTLSYQWYSNTAASATGGTPLTGATGTTYSPPAFANPGAFYFYATVSAAGNGCETASSALVTVNVNAAATASVFGPFSTCGASPVPVSATSSGTGTWSAPPGSGAFGTATSLNTTFTPASSSSQTINLTWTTADPDGSGPCPVVSANSTLTIYPPATASLSPTSNVCTNASLNLSATTNSPGSWTTSGSGTFGSTSNPVTTYTPVAGDISASPITITWTTSDPDGPGPCTSISVSQTVTVNQPPTVNAGPDLVLCLNSGQTTLQGSPAGGTWSGSGVSSSGQFDPVNPGTFPLNYTYTDANNCSATDPVTVNVNQLAIADANGPYAVCGAAAISLSATTNGTGTWSGGAGTFANATSASTTYTPAASEVGTTVTLVWETFDPDGNGPCSGAIDNTQLTITTPATATPGGPYTICSSDIANISVTSSPATGSWSGGAGIYGSNTSGGTTYDPATSESPATLTLTWTTTDPDGAAGPCPAVSANVTVNVLEAAIANANGPYAVCGAEAISLSATTNGTGTWSGGAGVFADLTNSSTTYTPAASEVGTTVTLVWETFDPDGNGPCSGAIDDTQLTISTPATAAPGGPYTICSSDIADISVTSSPATGAWTGGTGTYGSSTSSSTTYDPADSESPANLTLVWTTSDPDGATGPCPAVSVNVLVNILEEAIAVVDGPFTSCTNGMVEITSVSNGAGEWTWTPANLGELDDAQSNTATFTPNTSLFSESEVTLTWTTLDPDGSGPCSAASASSLINIVPPPSINLDDFFAIDCGDVISATASGGSETGFIYSWSPTSGIVSPTSASTAVNASGIYTLTVTDSNGCMNEAFTEISINELDQMAQADDAEVCLFDSVEIEGSATLGQAPFTYTWTPAIHLNPAAANTPVVSFSYSQNITADTTLTYLLNIVDALGCGDQESVTVTVHPLPVVEAGPDQAVCQDDASFPLTGYSPLETQGISADWSPLSNVDPASLDIGNNAFTYSFTDQFGCTNQDELNVVIHEVPQANFSAPQEACEGSMVQFSNSTLCPTCGVLSFQWDFGDATGVSTATSPQYTYQDTGYFDVTLNVQSPFGCVDSYTHTIHILALPVTAFTLSTDEGCGPLDVTIQNTTIGAGLTYDWNIQPFGIQNTANPGTITFPSAPCDSIFYEVSLSTSNLCGITSFADSVLVYSLPQPEFSVSSDTVCSSIALGIYNSTSCAWQTTYSWEMGDGVTSDSQELSLAYTYFAFDDFAEYPLTLTAVNPCGTVQNIQEITVVPNSITAFFNANPLIGCEPHPVQFDQEMLGVTYFSWDFGDGNTSTVEDPIHEFTQDGIYDVVFTAANFCGAQDTATVTVEVLPSPEIDFISTEEYLCVGESTSFIPSGDPVSGYVWEFGDGNGSNESLPTYIYSAEGEYEVTVTGISLLNGCPGSITNTISVITTPQADIQTSDLAGCPPFSAVFTNNTINAVNYFWNLGDGNFFVGDTLTHVFGSSGAYDVEIVAINDNSCADTTNIEITVYPSPTALFNYNTTDYNYQFVVYFDNYSIDAVAYRWEMGNGAVSYLTEPIYAYGTLGDCTYQPTLIAYNEFGCTDTTARTVAVPFEMNVYAPNTFTPNGDLVNDVFIVSTLDVEPELSHLQIIDRWGVTIHEAWGRNPEWDGFIDGEPAPNDAYQFIYTARERCGMKDYKKVGHVILVR